MACSPDPRLDLAAYARSLDCVHCGLCLPACPTWQELRLEAESPRGRVYLMRALAEGRVADPAAVRPHLDRCLDCRACETACPSGVRYGELIEATRAALERTAPRRGAAAWLVRTLLWQLVARQRRLRVAFRLLRAAEAMGLRWLGHRLGLLPAALAAAPPLPSQRAQRPLPRGLHRPPAGVRTRGVRVALFTGCVMEPLFGRVHRATLQVLLANGFEVVVPAAQRCCGALLVHAGHADRARELARANVAAFAEADVVVDNAAGCGCALGEYGHLLGDARAEAFARKRRDVTVLLATEGLSAAPAPCRARAAYDDPCHLGHGQGVRTAPRQLLAQVPGLELVPHARPEDCCGSAGLYHLLQPDLAGAIGRRKAASLVAAGVDLVLTGNPGCMLQIDSHLRAAGCERPVRHPIELLVPAT
ncbi:MAG: (Fe-S)-binding protein [Planctomycetes bacterium]|nr:(Fe-S)-binding protein [Planctomycetota bacterium]